GSVVTEAGGLGCGVQAENRLSTIDGRDTELRSTAPEDATSVFREIDQIPRPDRHPPAPDGAPPLQIPQVEPAVRAPGQQSSAIPGRPDAKASLAVDVPERLTSDCVSDLDPARIFDGEPAPIRGDGGVRQRTERGGVEEAPLLPDLVARFGEAE